MKNDLTPREMRRLRKEGIAVANFPAPLSKKLAKKYGWQRVELRKDIEDTASVVWKKVKEFLGK